MHDRKRTLWAAIVLLSCGGNKSNNSCPTATPEPGHAGNCQDNSQSRSQTRCCCRFCIFILTRSRNGPPYAMFLEGVRPFFLFLAEIFFAAFSNIECQCPNRFLGVWLLSFGFAAVSPVRFLGKEVVLLGDPSTLLLWGCAKANKIAAFASLCFAQNARAQMGNLFSSFFLFIFKRWYLNNRYKLKPSIRIWTPHKMAALARLVDHLNLSQRVLPRAQRMTTINDHLTPFGKPVWLLDQ